MHRAHWVLLLTGSDTSTVDLFQCNYGRGGENNNNNKWSLQDRGMTAALEAMT